MHFSWLSSFSPLEDDMKEDLTWGMNTTRAVRKVTFWWVSEEECPSEIPRVLLQLHLPQPPDLLPLRGSSDARRQETPQRVINSSEKITGCPLPSLPSSTPAFGSSLQGSQQQIDGLNLTLILNILYKSLWHLTHCHRKGPKKRDEHNRPWTHTATLRETVKVPKN